jgi:hypothetical protein
MHQSTVRCAGQAFRPIGPIFRPSLAVQRVRLLAGVQAKFQALAKPYHHQGPHRQGSGGLLDGEGGPAQLHGKTPVRWQTLRSSTSARADSVYDRARSKEAKHSHQASPACLASSSSSSIRLISSRDRAGVRTPRGGTITGGGTCLPSPSAALGDRNPCSISC